MKKKGIARSILTLAIIGTLVSAQQACAESVFTMRGPARVETLGIGTLNLANDSSPAAGAIALHFAALGADTVETFDVEVDEEKGPGLTKQLIVFGVITAIVGYAVIELMKSDDEPKVTPTSGKPVPSLPARVGIGVPITRSR